MRAFGAILLVAWLSLGDVLAKMPVAHFRPLPSLREQNALEEKWVQKRYELIPKLLKKHGYDAWILSMREYAEDTVFRALVPNTSVFSARRRTFFLFHTHPDIASPLHIIDNKADMWKTVLETLEKVNPKKIAVNIDQDMAFSDGLHSGEGQVLFANLTQKWSSRIEPCRALGVETVATRVGGKEQLDMYKLMMENVWAMIQEGFSSEAIEVGKTTAEDLVWWFRDYKRWKIGTGTWFQTDVDIVRSPDEPSVEEHPAIREGDMLHVDIGITAMGMNTDTQHLAYVLRPGETGPPKSLLAGLKQANRLQDLVRKEMVPGRTGDQVFWKVLNDMKEEGLEGDIYSHPIGDYGHSAGAVIGMANWQGSIPGGGGNKVQEHYWTSVELAGRSSIPEWGNMSQLLEEDVYWKEETGTFEWVFGQQTEFHLVHPRKHGHHGGHHGHHHHHHHHHGHHGHQGHRQTEGMGLTGWLAAQLGFDIVKWL